MNVIAKSPSSTSGFKSYACTGNQHNSLDHHTRSAKHKLFTLTFVIICWITGLSFTTAQAEDRISLTEPIKDLRTANNDVQYEISLKEYVKILSRSPCGEAINDFIDLHFAIDFNQQLLAMGSITSDNLGQAIKNLEGEYDSLENLAFKIVWVCGGISEGHYVLVNRLIDRGYLTDEPRRSQNTILSFNNLTKD